MEADFTFDGVSMDSVTARSLNFVRLLEKLSESVSFPADSCANFLEALSSVNGG